MTAKFVHLLRSTKDYKMFETHSYNRDIGSTRELEASMRKYGFDPGLPIRCVRTNGKRLRVTSGHHRLFVAQMLGLPVWYIISHQDMDIYQLEAPNRIWAITDWTTSRNHEGSDDAQRAMEFSTSTGIGLSVCLALLGGGYGGSTHELVKMKRGTFVIQDTTHAYIVADLANYLEKIGVRGAKSARMVMALSRVLIVPEFEVLVFKKKAKANTSMFEQCRSVDEYVKLLEEVYNRMTAKQQKIPLEHLCKQAVAIRQQSANKMRKDSEIMRIEYTPEF